MPFDNTPHAPGPEERRLLQETLRILQAAQLKIADERNWMQGASMDVRGNRRVICARQAVTEAIGDPHRGKAAYRSLALEAPAAITQYYPHETAISLIERANDMEGGHARVMGMFCRAIAKLESLLA